jgi:NAD(P)-dependent dehydrogenase (short-subunit alcohol dehydrogenase family)
MTDLTGKTIVITGATSGIGQAAAIALARQGARVLVVGRDHARGEATVQEMARVGETGEFLAANLLSLKDIARLAAAVKARNSSLDVLINNAGGVFRSRTMSADSIEATFALNTVAPFALTSHLHGALARANGRVVNIATGFLGRTRLNVDELIDPPSYSSFGSYSRAKLASIMLTMEQAERWKRDGISAPARPRHGHTLRRRGAVASVPGAQCRRAHYEATRHRRHAGTGHPTLSASGFR